jgi:hypothetical protein
MAESRVLRRICGPRNKSQEAGEDHIMRSFVICMIEYYQGDQVKEDEMGGLHGMLGRDEKCIQNFDQKT